MSLNFYNAEKDNMLMNLEHSEISEKTQTIPESDFASHEYYLMKTEPVPQRSRRNKSERASSKSQSLRSVSKTDLESNN